MSPTSLLKATLCALTITIHAGVFAQVKSDAWYPGKIELIDDHIYDVELRYVFTRMEGLLQVREFDEVVTLSPIKVKSFEFYDAIRDEHRRFVSVSSFMEHVQYRKKLFIEVLYDGNEISLLRRTDSFGAMPTESLYLMDHQTQNILPYAVSKYSRKNSSVYINADTKLLYQLTYKHKRELRDYVSRNSLKLKKPEDIITLLVYFDQLANLSVKDSSQ
ncbi:hypothetical protein QQ020_22105 [Fulvivirgaceae bacterium BMA12]|uniref:Uncharacterized protein n=1 Tax=Agaribacillus aureus TaxID=3051825 RepID=A0ABT8LAL5_9BACT|nr:hypothetical protein [Fulvivirgaceae bacterium BMA12]